MQSRNRSPLHFGGLRPFSLVSAKPSVLALAASSKKNNHGPRTGYATSRRGAACDPRAPASAFLGPRERSRRGASTWRSRLRAAGAPPLAFPSGNDNLSREGQ